jgi:hypothetical protein
MFNYLLFLFTIPIGILLLFAGTGLSDRILIGVALALFGIYGLTYALPVDEIFSGFHAVQGDASLGARYGPQIGLLGLVLSIVGLTPLIARIFKMDIASRGRADNR